MSESQFNYLTNSLNDELYSYWPCTLCFCFGYLFSPCTFGLSFMCPNMCISSAKENFISKLEYFNSKYFNAKMINITYHQKCSTSWLKLTRLDIDYSKYKSIDIKDNKYEKDNNIQTNTINMRLIASDNDQINNDKINSIKEKSIKYNDKLSEASTNQSYHVK